MAVARRERWEEEAREDDGAAMLMLLGWRGGGSVRGPGVAASCSFCDAAGDHRQAGGEGGVGPVPC